MIIGQLLGRTAKIDLKDISTKETATRSVCSERVAVHYLGEPYMQKNHSENQTLEIFGHPKSTNERLLDILLPRAVSPAEHQKILDFVSEKNAFSKKQSLALATIATRELNQEGI